MLRHNQKLPSSRQDGYNLCFPFGRSRIQFSAWRTTIMIAVFRGSPQPLQANSAKNLGLNNARFLPHTSNLLLISSSIMEGNNWEAKSWSASQDVAHVVGKLKGQAVFTRHHNWFLSSTRLIKSTTHQMSLRSILIASSFFRVCRVCVIFISRFSLKPARNFRPSHACHIYPPHLSHSLDWFVLMTCRKEKYHEIPH